MCTTYPLLCLQYLNLTKSDPWQLCNFSLNITMDWLSFITLATQR